MSTLEIFQTLALILGSAVIFIIVLSLLYKVINPYVYRITFTNKSGDKTVKYVKLMRELSLTTYQEIFINIRKKYSNIEDIKIERIYLKPYTNLGLFKETDFE